MSQGIEEIVCSAGCKRTAADAKEASNKGWEHLPIQQRWRCPECWRELKKVNEKFDSRSRN